jgi:type IV secretory pathway TrbD component
MFYPDYLVDLAAAVERAREAAARRGRPDLATPTDRRRGRVGASGVGEPVLVGAAVLVVVYGVLALQMGFVVALWIVGVAVALWIAGAAAAVGRLPAVRPADDRSELEHRAD